MNDLDLLPASEAPLRRPLVPAPYPDIPEPPPHPRGPRGGGGRRLFGLAVLAAIVAALAFGVWQHYQQDRQVAATAAQQATFVPSVRVEQVAQRHGSLHVSLPGTTLAFEQADIYARASGYVLKRNVDIGDHVRLGNSSRRSLPPKLMTRLLSFRTTCSSSRRRRGKMKPTARWPRSPGDANSVLVNQGWVTRQQGDTDRYTLQAQQHATQAAQNSAAAMQAQLQSTNQQKIYQQVLAPFDGVVTQRNIDVGSLITANATSGTSMFTVVQSDVIRVWVYVPQDSPSA